jgi:phosphoglycerate dehydrogenase-like enzyme
LESFYQTEKLKMLKVAILDDYQNVSHEFVDLKKLSGKYEFRIFSEPFIDEADAIEQLSDFEALLIMRERTPITKNLIDNLNDLKYIITSGSRNKAIDLTATKKRRILVCGTEIDFAGTTELTWGLILGLARNFKEEIDNMYQGYWQSSIGFELKGKILGLVGLGRVGSQVAKIGKAFGMEVMAWSENLNLDTCKELGVLPCSKEDLFQNSDFISIHVQGGERYKELIKLKELDTMKKTAFLINTSRGNIINEDDLIIALSTNVIAGAGLDVYEKEPLPEGNKLRFLPNALLMPHVGYVTAENYSMFYTQMIEGLESCVAGKPLRILEN